MASLSLAFNIFANDRNASRTLRGVGDAADDAGRRGSRFGDFMKRGMAVAATAIAGLGVVAVAGMKDAVAEASDLGESVNAVNVVFGEAAEGVLALSKNAAQAVGLSQTQFNGLSVQFSSFASKIAGPSGDVVKTLQDLTGRAADFASVMNLEVSEAASIFQSALSGETEPIKKFGIDLSAAAVEAHAYAAGIASAGEELTETQKVQARYSLIMAETAKTQGDFANTSDSLANRQRILGATWKDIQARLGQGLIPVMEGFLGFIADKGVPAIEALITNWENGTGVAGMLKNAILTVKDAAVGLFNLVVKGDFTGEFASAFGVFEDSAIVDKILRLREAVLGIFTLATDRNAKPLGDALGLDMQTTADLVKARDAVVDFGQRLADLWGEAQEAGRVIGESLKPVWDTLVFAWNNDLKPALSELFTVLRDELGPLFGQTAKDQGPMIQEAARFTAVLISKAVPTIIVTIKVLSDFIRTVASFVRPMVNAWMAAAEFGRQMALLGMRVQTAMGQTIAAVRNLPGMVAAALRGAGNSLVGSGRDLVGGLIRGITDRAGQAVQAIRDTVSRMVNAAKSLLEIRSPSRVFMRIGEQSVAGLAGGLEKADPVDGALKRLLSIPAQSADGLAMPTGPTATGGREYITKIYLDGREIASSTNRHLGAMQEGVIA